MYCSYGLTLIEMTQNKAYSSYSYLFLSSKYSNLVVMAPILLLSGFRFLQTDLPWLEQSVSIISSSKCEAQMYIG